MRGPVLFAVFLVACDTNANKKKNTPVCDTVYFADVDGDGFGDPASTATGCAAPDGFVEDDTDCDDADAEISPGNDELCDDIDHNCDGLPEDGAVDVAVWYSDADGDGYGDPNRPIVGCLQPGGTVTNNEDCEDSLAGVNPDGVEVCNGFDDDCDPSTSEAGMVSVVSDGVIEDATHIIESAPKGEVFQAFIDNEDQTYLCEGTYNVSFQLIRDHEIIGIGDPESVVLSAAGEDYVVAVVVDGLDIRLSNLTLQEGIGFSLSEYTAGGAVYCAGNSSLALDGVIVRDSEADHGGGVLSDGCTVTVASSQFLGNSASSSGGGLMVSGAPLTVEDSLFEGNSGYLGAGLFTVGTTNTITDTTFSANAGAVGGGMALLESDSVIDGALFSENTSTSGASGLFVESGEADISASDFSDNTSDWFSAGLLVSFAELTLRDSTIRGNTGDVGAGIRAIASTVEMIGVSVTDNTANISGGGLDLSGSEVTGSDCHFSNNTPADAFVNDTNADYTLGTDFFCDARGCN